MALMIWSKHFVTGIDVIDTHHKGLVDLINAAAPQLATIGDAPARGVRPLLDRLADYALTHFHYEEALMLASEVDPRYVTQHQRSHTSFAQEVMQMIRDASADNNVSGANLLRFLTSWLTFHILSEDQHLACQLRAIQAGASPAEALATVPTSDPSANAVLVGALTDLFSLVTLRNRSLKALNEQLRLAKNELARANEELEARVAERTTALKLANTELERERGGLLASLTQIQQVQAQLLQSEKMATVGQLAAGVAHEISNPIDLASANVSALNAYSERLVGLIDACQEMESALPSDHPARLSVAREREEIDLDYLRQSIPDLFRESREGLARVKRIVSDLRDFSRADEGEWQDVDINYGLQSALNVAWSELKHKAEIVTEFGELPLVRCIPAQINQVFMNLLVNAAQAIETSGVLTLRTSVADGKVRVEISDTGKGIPDDLQTRIFEPFVTTKAVGQGPGLGLAISWDIIKRHDGAIEVKSAAGAGSTFTVTLPIAARATAAMTEAA